jgi:integrase
MKYIKKRGDRFHYVRRVPNDIRHLDNREFIQISLKTDSQTEAKQRAALLDQQIQSYWSTLLTEPHKAEQQYRQAIKLVRMNGLNISQTHDIANSDIQEIVQRVMLTDLDTTSAQTKALLGKIDAPQLTLSEALDKYWALSRDKQLGKSENQIRKWKNPRIKAINNFIAITGDKSLDTLTRDDVLNFKDWWLNRIEEETLTPNSANKDINHLRGVLQTVNDDLRLDLPIIKLFERTNLKDSGKSNRLSFTPEFVQNTLLNPTKMEGLNHELQYFIGAMAETGARISELVGLDAENGDIVLNTAIPYIHIRENSIRKLKTPHSERIIPLVGAALKCFQAYPNGFKQYKGRPDSLSSALNKWLRENEILPSPDHSLYSLRHCFQDRLIAVEAQDRLQAELMGHKFYRPKYGSGASLEQKVEWLNKISLVTLN